MKNGLGVMLSFARRASMLGALGMASCGGSVVAPFDGSWTGTWTVTSGEAQGSLEMSLHHVATTVSGSVTLGGTLCVGSGDLDATVDPSGELTGSFSNGIGGAVSIDGDVDDATQEFSGRFDVTGGICKGTTGTFKLTH